MKKAVSILVSLAVLGGAGWYFAGQKKGAGKNDQDGERLTARVEKRDIEFHRRSEWGYCAGVSARREARGGRQGQGAAHRRRDTVKEGDLLVEIDDRDLLTEKDSVAYGDRWCPARGGKNRRNFQRGQDLFDSKLISREVFDNLSSAFDLSQNSLVRSQRKLQLVEDKLRKTKVAAPMEGTVLTLPVIEGQVVIAAASVNSGTSLMTLANLSTLIVATHVNQVGRGEARF
jgi:hypothetical protein